SLVDRFDLHASRHLCAQVRQRCSCHLRSTRFTSRWPVRPRLIVGEKRIDRTLGLFARSCCGACYQLVIIHHYSPSLASVRSIGRWVLLMSVGDRACDAVVAIDAAWAIEAQSKGFAVDARELLIFSVEVEDRNVML